MFYGATYLGSVWRWRRRARWVGRGRVDEGEEVRLLGTGIVWVSGEMEVEDGGGMAGWRGRFGGKSGIEIVLIWLALKLKGTEGRRFRGGVGKRYPSRWQSNS
jgi:hypothetical protein